MNIKVGLGYDVHRFATGRRLFLGGVEIDHTRGLDGHSDADVLVHALCDALLGAIGKGDIGEHFPNTDPQYRNISSLVLLQKVMNLVHHEGFKVGNVDAVIQAEEPHLKKHKPTMKAALAKALAIEENSVNIKATTQEGMGAIGRREGIAAFVTVLIYKD